MLLSRTVDIVDATTNAPPLALVASTYASFALRALMFNAPVADRSLVIPSSRALFSIITVVALSLTLFAAVTGTPITPPFAPKFSTSVFALSVAVMFIAPFVAVTLLPFTSITVSPLSCTEL